MITKSVPGERNDPPDGVRAAETDKEFGVKDDESKRTNELALRVAENMAFVICTEDE